MLVLSRHRDEAINIGDEVVITVVDIRGDKVRLGIEAPADLPVHRNEVYQAIQRQKRSTAGPIIDADISQVGLPTGRSNETSIMHSMLRLRPLVGTMLDLPNAPAGVIADMWKLAQAYMAEHGGKQGNGGVGLGS